MIIGVLSQKGGVGKTTVAVGLAGAFVAMDLDVQLIDADPQQSATDWYSRALGYGNEDGWPDVVPMDEDMLYSDLMERADDCDVTIIDTPPRLEALARSVLAAADLALVVLTPSPLDFDAVATTAQLVSIAQSARLQSTEPDLSACMLLSKVDPRTRISTDIREALGGSQFDGIPLLDVSITERVQLREAGIMGHTIQAYCAETKTEEEFAELAEDLVTWWQSEIDSEAEDHDSAEGESNHG